MYISNEIFHTSVKPPPSPHFSVSFVFCFVVQRLQQNSKQKEQELQAQQEELHTLRQRVEKADEARGRQDREELTLLTQRVDRAEDSARQLAAKLQEKVRIQQACGVCRVMKYYTVTHTRISSCKQSAVY